MQIENMEYNNIIKTININGNLKHLDKPLVMGIINITPDSFYTHSRAESQKALIGSVLDMIESGADIIDIGGQSSNPQSPWLNEQEEWVRVESALSTIRDHFPDIIISLDTFYSSIAEKSVRKYNANIINDISGGEFDKEMFATIARLQVPYILMHMRGTPQTMQSETNYENFIQEVFYYFSDKVSQLNQLGVNDIIIDPGFGFAKDVNQNYELMGTLTGFDVFNLPILVGISRKSMIYKLLQTDANHALNGTTILNTYAVMKGANIIRVHDVQAAKEIVTIVSKIREKTI